MLTLIDANGPYQLPTGWHEVATRQYCQLLRNQAVTVAEAASCLAGRDVELSEITVEALGWLGSPPPVAGGRAYPADLGQQSYLQVELLREQLTKQPLGECLPLVYGLVQAHTAKLLPVLVEAFTQANAETVAERCAEWPITETWPTVAHCLAELQRLDEAFAVLSLPDETEAGRRARQAGSERLAPFGHLNVARHYAQQFSTTIDAVYQWPWQTVAVFLVQDRLNAEIADNLSKQSDSSNHE